MSYPVDWRRTVYQKVSYEHQKINHGYSKEGFVPILRTEIDSPISEASEYRSYFSTPLDSLLDSLSPRKLNHYSEYQQIYNKDVQAFCKIVYGAYGAET